MLDPKQLVVIRFLCKREGKAGLKMIPKLFKSHGNVNGKCGKQNKNNSGITKEK
jgi:hypothetical protein